ncbi:hypothetical protein A9179_11340 [Pseudomonas alcaligenes]|uniref:DUF2783 domain-containing protein n=1 Tax=Aquipseudomonas alcaligenes TaxID=43263 RepID=A0ABR7RZV3_AQUAC|nr:hypothetical protein [Pseudomonas alcaligenes]MBC9250871.1 hypothetical protein [Pseudomonas alcaligenes]
MTSLIRNMRKTIDIVADHNEDAALAVMRAAEHTGDEGLKQQLLGVILRLNQDAQALRQVRENLPLEQRKSA